MQKLRSKLGLVVVLSCLTLAVGLMASTGSASANGGHHPHVSRISPRISMKILSGHFKFHGHYVQRVVLSGVGFDTCDSCANAAAYNGCDGSCSNSGCDACSASCPYYFAANACGDNCQACDAPGGNSCANYNACGTDGSNGPSSCPSNCGGTTGNIGSISGNGSSSCPSNCGSTTGNTGVVGSTNGNGSVSCPSNCDGTTANIGSGNTSGNGHPACASHCGNSTGNVVVGTSNSSHPACSSNCNGTTGNIGVGSTSGNGSSSCPSNCDGTAGNAGIGTSDNGSASCPSDCDGTTGNIGVSSTSGAPCANYNACGNASSCDCANVQSNLPIYGQDANLSQVPLNAFGEFRVTVLVVVPAHSSRANYRMWAINRYNNDCSNILSGSQGW